LFQGLSDEDKKKLKDNPLLCYDALFHSPLQGEKMSKKRKKINQIVQTKKDHSENINFQDSLLKALDKSNREYFLDYSGVHKALEKFIEQDPINGGLCNTFVKAFKDGDISYSLFREKILGIVKKPSVHPKSISPIPKLFKKSKKSKLEISLPEGLGLNTLEQEMLDIDTSIEGESLSNDELKKKRILEIIKKDIKNKNITNWLSENQDAIKIDTEDNLKNFLKFCNLPIMQKSQNIPVFLEAFKKAQNSESAVKDLLEFCNLPIMNTTANFTQDLLNIFTANNNDKQLTKEFSKFCDKCIYPLDRKAENYINFALERI
jgi:hypothetical protein